MIVVVAGDEPYQWTEHGLRRLLAYFIGNPDYVPVYMNEPALLSVLGRLKLSYQALLYLRFEKQLSLRKMASVMSTGSSKISAAGVQWRVRKAVCVLGRACYRVRRYYYPHISKRFEYA